MMFKRCAAMPLNVVVIGGSRGIGLGFVKEYLAQGHKVLATYRDNGKSDGLQALKESNPQNLELCELEITDYKAIGVFKEKIHKPIDILILNAGVMQCPPGSQLVTETIEQMRQTMEINTYAPDQIMRVLFDKLLHPNSCAVYISSTLSCTSANLKGRYQSYRASKAAGNIIFQNWNIQLAKEWLDKGGELNNRPCAFPISPGVVQTDMGGPTSPLTVVQSVSGMVRVINDVREHKHCSLYLYDGSVLDSYPEPEWVTAKMKQESMVPN